MITEALRPETFINMSTSKKFPVQPNWEDVKSSLFQVCYFTSYRKFGNLRAIMVQYQKKMGLDKLLPDLHAWEDYIIT